MAVKSAAALFFNLINNNKMQVETKEFWEQVKKEYKPLNDDCYICYYSDTFKEMWNDISGNRQDFKVVEYAKSFLIDIKDEIHTCNTISIFCVLSNIKGIKLRKQFIDYMINKFS